MLRSGLQLPPESFSLLLIYDRDDDQRGRREKTKYVSARLELEMR